MVGELLKMIISLVRIIFRRVAKGLLPCRNMAYYISYESALAALYRELDERKIIDSNNDKAMVC